MAVVVVAAVDVAAVLLMSISTVDGQNLFRTVHKPTFSDSPRPPVNVCGEKPRAGFVPVAEVLHLSTGPSCQR